MPFPKAGVRANRHHTALCNILTTLQMLLFPLSWGMEANKSFQVHFRQLGLKYWLVHRIKAWHPAAKTAATK